ncbi:hypothetical protein PP637_gp43 [Arthrobacter phage Persistence]|uniref:Uncharacterized protein n=1 Tax=Arthrobacter phage Persistence TaxID=2836007 RepID=A0A8F3IIC1_9CAUD|nr:hypothetical protein PP637_gp43 [Arthrobacter phage Persistence]QWY79673.1 hypothetical protein SEA_PERSISTENCE_43 [Arthrobacter phage Persistence]
MSAREEIAKLLFVTDNHAAPDPEHEWEMTSRHNPAYAEYVYVMADAILAAGYTKMNPVAAKVEALREAANEAKTRGDIGKEGGPESWDWLHWRADHILKGGMT